MLGGAKNLLGGDDLFQFSVVCCEQGMDYVKEKRNRRMQDQKLRADCDASSDGEETGAGASSDDEQTETGDSYDNSGDSDATDLYSTEAFLRQLQVQDGGEVEVP